MKRKSRDEEVDELRAEYDLGELLKTAVQGKYADRSGQNRLIMSGKGASAIL
ncbi:MAG: hypothetical protein MUC41_04755 [Syntrophobacteraceae bacterium]|nr:hypothetical protein [Syntrophobacteraceae bacterium]